MEGKQTMKIERTVCDFCGKEMRVNQGKKLTVPSITKEKGKKNVGVWQVDVCDVCAEEIGDFLLGFKFEKAFNLSGKKANGT